MEHLYACLFSDGLIKVGRSISPQARIAAHAERVACAGLTLMDWHSFTCTSAADCREALLIERCAAAATERHKSEWFAGLVFSVVCAWAEEAARADILAPSCEMIALDDAFAAVNGVGSLAFRLGVAASLPSMWRSRSSVPAEYCPAIERETGVRCERLRPDVAWDVLRTQAGNRRE